MRVTGIFTSSTISPGGLSRQCPNRYAIRAGQNLPDKEFRYLRTVIVTAAVYRGFNSMLRVAPNISSYPSGTGQASAPIRRLSTLQRPVFLINSRLGLFTAAGHRPAPLIPKLRGQFAEFLDNPSPVGLRILSSSTCVGLRYGRLSIRQGFSRLNESSASLL